MDLQPFRYHYLDEGRGDPLLMVHGNPTWSFYWRHLVTAFRNRWRVVVPDHLGCGMSDRPQGMPCRLEMHIDNLIRLIEHLDLRRITLFCHDWGGAIGLGAAVRRPERFARFVVFNTGAFPPPYVPLRIRLCRFPVLGRWALLRLNLFARAAIRMATNHPERMTPVARAGLLAPYDCPYRREGIWRFVADIPLSRRHPTYDVLADLEDRLPSLRPRPFQFIWGMKDWCFLPECLDRFSRLLPESEVERIEDAGHYVVQDAHERIVPLVEQFFQRHPLPVEG